MSQKPIELQLDSMAHGGEAVGRHEGKVIFVPYAIPGEVVHVCVVEEHKQWARAVVMGLVKASPQRVEPPCPYFGTCGGCQWQHIDYQAQLAFKRQVVVDQLQRLGHIAEPRVRPAAGTVEPWFYRNHVQLGISALGGLGFQAARSHRVVPIARCLVAHPLLGELFPAFDRVSPDVRRVSLRAGIYTGERLCILETEGTEVPALRADLSASCVLLTGDGREVPLHGESAYHETLDGKRFRVSASSFFQVNTRQTEALLHAVRSYLVPQQSDALLDVYCGVGTLGLSLLDEVGHVIGVEEHPAAVADARANAAAVGAGASHVTCMQGPAETVLPGLQKEVSKVIVDPPRQGCLPQVIDALLRLRPQRLVYVSCDPATLARDAAALTGGGYRLVEVWPVDMFPQTYHVETVSLWEPLEGTS
jgi:23S rRNA (uracil1939-C5)-methyltransferase